MASVLEAMFPLDDVTRHVRGIGGAGNVANRARV
jgi:hypothetical protein